VKKTPPDKVRKNERRVSAVATINDVARRAGVSPMTVSRVVNENKNVRAETREAVLSAIRALQYAPNPAARSLAGAQGIRIGLLYNNPSIGYLSEFLIGALDECSRNSAQLVLEKCAFNDGDTERAAVHKLVQGGVAGVILPSSLHETVAIQAELQRADISAVAVATGSFGQEISCVRIDDHLAAYEMTGHLLAQGHRRIGFIKGHPNEPISEERLKGFEAALREAGYESDKKLIVQGYFSYRSGLEAAEILLSRKVRPTAIFASNDDMAAAVVSVAHRKGLEVPRDLSVAGFDDTPIAATLWPELTTIRQPIAQMAEIALDLIIRDIRRRKTGSKTKPVSNLVAHTLVRRQSVAAPNKRL
jgi:LacI family transcriptional regulator